MSTCNNITTAYIPKNNKIFTCISYFYNKHKLKLFFYIFLEIMCGLYPPDRVLCQQNRSDRVHCQCSFVLIWECDLFDLFSISMAEWSCMFWISKAKLISKDLPSCCTWYYSHNYWSPLQDLKCLFKLFSCEIGFLGLSQVYILHSCNDSAQCSQG